MFWKPYKIRTFSEFENVTKLLHQFFWIHVSLALGLYKVLENSMLRNLFVVATQGCLSISGDKRCSPFLCELFPLDGNIDFCTMLLHPLDIVEGPWWSNQNLYPENWNRSLENLMSIYVDLLKRRHVKTWEQGCYWLVYWFPRVAITKYQKLDNLKQHKFIPLYSGSQKSEVKTMFSFNSSREEHFLAFSSFWGFLSILGIPWLVDASLQSHGHLLPVCLPPMCVFLCPTFPFL